MHESDKKTVTKQDIHGGYAGGGSGVLLFHFVPCG